MSEDKYLSAKVEYDGQRQMLAVTVEAKKTLTITELQGYTSTLQQFGASMPSNFEAKKFGEGVEITPEFELEMQILNESQFRWGTEVSIMTGQTHTIRIPATKSSDEGSVFTILYSLPRRLACSKATVPFMSALEKLAMPKNSTEADALKGAAQFKRMRQSRLPISALAHNIIYEFESRAKANAHDLSESVKSGKVKPPLNLILDKIPPRGPYASPQTREITI